MQPRHHHPVVGSANDCPRHWPGAGLSQPFFPPIQNHDLFQNPASHRRRLFLRLKNPRRACAQQPNNSTPVLSLAKAG